MKKSSLYLTLALACTLPSTLRLAAQDAPEHTAAPHHKAPDTELGKTMEQMSHAWRKLRRQADDPASNASSLELVGTISAAANKALTLQPDKTKDLPEADRAKFVADYQTEIKKLIVQIGKLQDAFKAGDNAGAQAIMKEMGALQKEGHKEFRRPEKH